MYPFMTLPDNTEITHSEIRCTDQNRETVRVYIETPVYNGFKSAECYLPDYTWTFNGYDEEEIRYLKDLIQSVSHVIIGLARDGGFPNAANF